jgi:hypothetical protein
MNLELISDSEITKIIRIYPIINELVDTLYIKSINTLINIKCETDDDRRVFLMFIIIYFYSYFCIPNGTLNDSEIKIKLKLFLNDLISDQNKRQSCINLYKLFEINLKKNLQLENTKEIKEIKEIKNNTFWFYGQLLIISGVLYFSSTRVLTCIFKK